MGDRVIDLGTLRHDPVRIDGFMAAVVMRLMSALEAAEQPEQMNYPGSCFHSLKGDRENRFSVRLRKLSRYIRME